MELNVRLNWSICTFISNIWIISTTPMERQLATQVHPNFFPCRSHLAGVIQLHAQKQQSVNNLQRNCTVCSATTILIGIKRNYLLTQRKRVCCIHVIICTKRSAGGMPLCYSNPLPECCRRSRSRPVTGSCRGPPGPRSDCWGCGTGAFSSSGYFGFSSSRQRMHSQGRNAQDPCMHACTHTHVCVFLLIFFLFLGGWGVGWVS